MRILKFIQNILCKRKLKMIQHGDGSHIGANTKLMNSKNIHIGNNSYINGGYLIAGEHSSIRIGNNCLISYDVHIRCKSHNYIKKEQLILEQGEFEKDIVIEDDCWIGFGAQIMAGVTIAEGCVIGAGAIVTHDTKPYEVWGGIPARKIKMRV